MAAGHICVEISLSGRYLAALYNLQIMLCPFSRGWAKERKWERKGAGNLWQRHGLLELQLLEMVIKLTAFLHPHHHSSLQTHRRDNNGRPQPRGGCTPLPVNGFWLIAHPGHIPICGCCMWHIHTSCDRRLTRSERKPRWRQAFNHSVEKKKRACRLNWVYANCMSRRVSGIQFAGKAGNSCAPLSKSILKFESGLIKKKKKKRKLLWNDF